MVAGDHGKALDLRGRGDDAIRRIAVEPAGRGIAVDWTASRRSGSALLRAQVGGR
jgi:hypothetical protein